MKQVNVALLGLGTVGTGVYKMIMTNQDVIARRTGRFFDIRGVLVRDRKKKRQIEGVEKLLTDQFAELFEQKIDVVIEAMGGLEPAFDYVKEAIERGCHVVTANKELIARHGVELEALAEKQGVQLLFEASVGGGIPVLGTLQHFLKANRVYRVMGIVNGTTNYILTQMEERGRSFADVLKEAQEKGYAEADPSADVEGWDATHKITILSRIVFGTFVQVDDVPRQGITDITLSELQLAKKLGYKVKLLAQAEQFGENGPISCSVEPTLVPLAHPLAGIHDVYNAVYVEGDHVQDLTLVGQGAGEQPTASAVVEDLTNVYQLPRVYAGAQKPSLFVSQQGTSGLTFVLLQSEQPVQEVRLRALFDQIEQTGAEVLQWSILDNQVAFLLNQHDDHWQTEVQKQGWKDIKIRSVLQYGELPQKQKRQPVSVQ
jgi:homoserine dehydrogenase